jgi:hypothetical protein
MQSFKLMQREIERQNHHVIGLDALFIRTRNHLSINMEVCLFFLHAQNLVQFETFHEHSSLHHALAHSYFWLIKRHASYGIRLLRPPQPSARPILWSLRLIQSSPLGFVARHRVRFAMLVLSVTLLLMVEDDIRSDAHNVWDPSVDGGRGEARPKLTMVHSSRNLHNFARLYGNFEHN